MKILYRLIGASAILLSTVASAAHDNFTRWVERPWEIRYILFVSDADMYHSTLTASRATNRKRSGQVDARTLEARVLFRPTNIFRVHEKTSIVTVLLAFNNEGRPVSQDLGPGRWIARRNVYDRILLIEESNPRSRPYMLANWAQGIPGDMTFSPAVCAYLDVRRYDDGWPSPSYFGGFGCREWTAQLYNWQRPYIDVTSYEHAGSFIGEFVGWSRFEDPPKPVIGRHGKTWLCLHDCPEGEQPGAIGNIETWARKHGFPLPKRPPRQPMYPNSIYLDDIKEFRD